MAGGARVLALTGGVGGAKLALGLARELGPRELSLLVNTADDFKHLGLHISPDIDTLLYTLSGRSSRERGWGLEGETWQVREALENLGAETWFQLGDRDLATHLLRSGRLAAGDSLTAVTRLLGRAMGLEPEVLPMSDDPVSTVVHTAEGDLPFQHYFVRRACEPAVSGFSFEGIEGAAPNPALLERLAAGEIAAVVICPSNPFVSVDPVLQLPGLWQRIAQLSVPVIAVSPIVGGRAIKGPAAKMLAELGMPVDAGAVARHYAARYPGLVDTFVIDSADAALADSIAELGMAVAVTGTLMESLDDKRRLARFVLARAGL
ncbi:2-phospho-L-lactate transferase [Parahaliea mediterranea]|uniref:2-phospho-L-lactate transferase n=1 Tax=Parahaliea mediterranea TaxID=651086 RepID=A0A939IMZ1_9GAMM|nr:2-phospho-L-lactate transferase [Parahaliea mediterranea]MBN7798030.1 2-phospho-L-lactate transferase [Parahaliea mediterranea]